MSTSKNRHTSYGPTMTLDCGNNADEPDGNPVASYPPWSRLAHGQPRQPARLPRCALRGCRGRPPSKLRDALTRLNTADAQAQKKQLADLNQRNRERYSQGGKNK
jgi:hypothetical protein